MNVTHLAAAPQPPPRHESHAGENAGGHPPRVPLPIRKQRRLPRGLRNPQPAQRRVQHYRLHSRRFKRQ
eukprot:8193789-Pyramimonas_sp.AAC.1